MITVPVAGQVGLIVDQPPQELPINGWSRAQNMRFKDGCAERIEGEGQIYTLPSVTPYYIDAYQNGTSRYFIHAGIASVFADDGTTRTDITGTPLTGAQDNRFSGGTLNGVWILNNGVDPPKFWGGTGSLATLTGWDANWRAAVVRPFKNYLVALDITKSGTRYPHMVKWSAAAVPGAIPTSWDSTDPTKDAGEQDLAEEPSQMIDCKPLADMNVIYKERSMWAMVPGGYPYIWTFRRLPGDVGALGRGCIAEYPGGHVVLTAGDVISHSGQGPQSIINARLRKTLFTTIDSTYYKRSFVVQNPSRNEVWVCFPTAGQTIPDVAYIWNYIDNTWTTRQLANATYGAVGQINYAFSDSWDATTSAWVDTNRSWNNNPFSPASARLLLTTTAPQINLVDGVGTFNNASYVSVIERTGLTLEKPDIVKLLNELWPRVDASTGTRIQIEFGASMSAEQAPIYSAPIIYTVGQSLPKVDSFAKGKFLAIRLTSLDNQFWRIKSFDLNVVESGRY